MATNTHYFEKHTYAALSLAPPPWRLHSHKAMERELKYSSPDGHVPGLADLNAALKATGTSAVDAGQATQTDLYYDDDSRTVNALGMALRVRTVAGVRYATLKSRGSVMHGLHERQEFEQQLPEGIDLLWPDSLAAKLPGVNLDNLSPRMLITTQRRRFDILHQGLRVAELAFDEVVCQPAAQVALSYSIDQASFSEVELELIEQADGAAFTVEQLQQVGQALQDLIDIYPSDITKLERAATLLGAFEE